MKYILTILILLCVNSLRAYNPFWTNLDKKIIKNLVKIDKDSVHLFEEFFESENNKERINLGFGWKVWAPSKSGGYISISSEFFYFNDSLVSLRINGQLPDEEILKNKYLKWYNDYFKLFDKKQLLPLTYNLTALYTPLAEFKDSIKVARLNNELFSLMKPTTSIYYFWSGGYGNSMQNNRKVFMENYESLNFEELILMTYSKNPITRFLAIEELIRENYLETKCTKENLDWIERCFNEIPTVRTLNGCMGSKESSKNLVYHFSQMEYY